MNIPEKITDINTLEDFIAEPYPETVELMKELDGDILILGVSGKMGPTLAMLAVNAIKKSGVQKKVIGAATFRDEKLRDRLESFGIETIKCDLLNIDEVRALPNAKNVIFMAGRKFGEVGSEALTWMMNAVVPGNVGYARACGGNIGLRLGEIILIGKGGQRRRLGEAVDAKMISDAI